MAKVVEALIPLLSSVALLLAMANTVQSQRSLSFTYDFYGDQPADLLLLNDTHYPIDTTYLRLTGTDSFGNPNAHSVGIAAHRIMMEFKRGQAQSDFETTVKFLITPKDDHPADGLTFFLYPGFSESGFPSDSSGSNFGIFSESNPSRSRNTFAVEFDTFSNTPFDPSYRHVGIDIGSKTSANTTQIGDALVGQEVTARINYNSATKLIDVHVAAASQTFQVTFIYDLAEILPQYVIVGLSSATGGNVANHDIISWYFSSTLVGAAANTAEQGAHIRQIV